MSQYVTLSASWPHTRMRAHALFVPPAVRPQWEERRNWSWLLKIIEQIARRHATAAGYSCCAMWGHPPGDQRGGNPPPDK